MPTIEETYEYRVKNILRDFFNDDELEEMTSEDLFSYLHNASKDVGKALINDMLVWMSEEDWLELIRST